MAEHSNSSLIEDFEVIGKDQLGNLPKLNRSEKKVTNQLVKKKERKKRVSFHEPPVIATIEGKPVVVASVNGVIEEESKKEVDTYITHEEKTFKVPEISELWWSNIDDGSEGEPQTELRRVQLRIRTFIDHIWVRVFGIFLILLDLILMIVDLSLGNKPHTTQTIFDALAMTLSCIFMIDLFLRIFSYKPREFFRSVWEVVDGFVVVVTFAVTVFYTAVDSQAEDSQGQSNLGRLVSLARIIRIVRIVRIIYAHRHLSESGRRTISMNKRRYRKDGFDLDLTYVTDNVIAMSFPSSGMQSVYRNPIKEVRRFFETKHPGKYKIYNLCSERSYDAGLFENRVYRVLIDDHNVPSIKDLLDFLKDAREWMSQDSDNVIAIHCKGGKGRTGTVVCSWLIDQGKFKTAKEALEYFGIRRTDLEVGQTFQGVETASQIRYVGYYEKIKKDLNGFPPPEKKVRVTRIDIKSIAGVGRGNGSDLSLEILMNKEEALKCNFGEGYNCKISYNERENSVSCDIFNCPVLSGDIKFRFTSSAKTMPTGYDNCAFYFWINTGFVDESYVSLSRDELDNPHKQKTWHIFQEDFSVKLYFDDSTC